MTAEPLAPPAGVVPAASGRRNGLWLFRRTLTRTEARIGVALIALVVAVAFIGPYVAPHDPAEVVGIPYSKPGGGFVLGTDYLGRDVLSRFLVGGRSMLLLVAATLVLSYVIGVTLGLLAALVRGWAESVLTTVLDVSLAFPPLLFVLVLLAGFGTTPLILVLGVTAIFAPRIARIVKGAASQWIAREFVEIAHARGERSTFIMFREVLPNTMPTILSDFGVRLTWTIIVIASLGFLGFGQQPPAADWGLLISENRSGLTAQPWATIPSLVALAVITVGANLIADGMTRVLGRSVTYE